MVRLEQRRSLDALAQALDGNVTLGNEVHPARLFGRREPVAAALGLCAITRAPVDPELLRTLDKLGIG